MATLKYKKDYKKDEIPFLEDYDMIKYLLKDMYRNNILTGYTMTYIKIEFDFVVGIECWFEKIN